MSTVRMTPEREQEIRNRFARGVGGAAHNAGAVGELLTELDAVRAELANAVERRDEVLAMALEYAREKTEKQVAQIEKNKRVSKAIMDLTFDI